MADPVYDVVILGSGPAGYVCAIRAAQCGLKTAVVEKETIGGVCLNVGCIPSKALLRSAEIVRLLRTGGKEFGFSIGGLEVDYSVSVRRSRMVSNRLVKGVEFLLKKNNIDVFRGQGRILRPGEVRLTPANGAESVLTARHIVVATGARPAFPPNMQSDGRVIVSYQEAILQTALPSSAIIVGGGPIGLEFATIWSGFGVPVTVVEMLPRIAPLEEEEASAELAKAFERRGVALRTGTKVLGVDVAGDSAAVRIESDGKAETLTAGQVLVATGFRPNSEDLGLEALGVEMEKGRIQVDGRMATNIPGIWAVGDVTGKLMLAHVGSAMGYACAENIAGRESALPEYENMPRGIYTQPQVASFGITEAQAAARGTACRTARFPFQANGKALGLGEYAGWAKIVVAEDSGRLLGAQLVGPEVTELLPELTLAAAAGLSAEAIARNIHAHPTLGEALMEAAHGVSGGYIHL